jgi:hypothetical protein
MNTVPMSAASIYGALKVTTLLVSGLLPCIPGATVLKL